MTKQIQVEILYIGSSTGNGGNTLVFHHTQTMPSGATLVQALNASGVYKKHPETTNLSVGIFSKQKPLDTILEQGDRIEIYRPLLLDPKEQRRKRV
ncbi:MAG: RnfH family protein [Legionella sp.]|nr:RnfH family protein [Legionella sp.]